MIKDLTHIAPEDIPRQMCSVAFFDLDGTLVNGSGQIHQRCVRSIRALIDLGVSVCLASGRPYFAAKDIIEALGVRSPCMFFGGAMVVDPASGRPVYSSCLDSAKVLDIIRHLKPKGFHLELYTVEDCFVENQTELGRIHEQYLKRAMRIGRLEAIAATQPILKLVAIAAGQEHERQLRSAIKELPGVATGIAYGASHPGIIFVNITSIEASRENCFEFFLRHFGVGPQQVLAFGDGEADIPFLARAGIGIAMGNAHPMVKEASRFVTVSVDEQGVAFALNRLYGIN